MIEEKYKPQAAVAADALRAALLAVEDCGADVELTNIVVGLSDARSKLCALFDLPGWQAFQVRLLGGEPERMVEVEVDLLASLVVDDDCSFDHHGGCQAHGYLSLEPGEKCPQAELKALLA